MNFWMRKGKSHHDSLQRPRFRLALPAGCQETSAEDALLVAQDREEDFVQQDLQRDTPRQHQRKDSRAAQEEGLCASRTGIADTTNWRR
jgi:hypothetical protein